MYESDHEAFPASAVGDGPADFDRQLTGYTDIYGASNAFLSKDASHPYGPYLRSIPPLPAGTKKGSATVKIAADADAAGSGPEAWIYYPTTGEIKPNLADAEVDAKGVPYNQY
jgi:hypothetical protein